MRLIGEGVGVFAEKKWASDGCVFSVIADRLSYRPNVRFGEGSFERGAAMTTGAETNGSRGGWSEIIRASHIFDVEQERFGGWFSSKGASGHGVGSVKKKGFRRMMLCWAFSGYLSLSGKLSKELLCTFF
jgi:hypothetical protein